MKKIIYSFAAVVCALTIAQGQCKYGPRLALGVSNLGGGNAGIGAQVGVFINAELRDRIGIQGEVLYSLYNGNTTFTSTNVAGDKLEYKNHYNFRYIDIPLYGFVPLSKHITFLFGPVIGIVNKATTYVSGPNITDDQKTDIPDVKAKLGLAAGIDFNTASPLRFGLRYSNNGGTAFAGKSNFFGVTAAYYMDW